MTVTLAVPPAAVLLAVSVSTLVVLVEVELQAAVTPAGSPDTARLTEPVNPKRSCTPMTEVLLAPSPIERLCGKADSEK